MADKKPVFLSLEERNRMEKEEEEGKIRTELERKKRVEAKISSFGKTPGKRIEVRSRSPRNRSPERQNRVIPGTKTQSQPFPKLNDKYKRAYNPDWEPSEDTSQPLEAQIQPKLLFGKGTFGGVESHLQTESRNSWKQKPVEKMSSRDWRIFREDQNIIVKGGKVPDPIRSWEDSDLPFNMQQAVKTLGYTTPTAIQMQAVPCGLEAKDLLALAPTGSGKSAAFLLPLLTHLQTLPELDSQSAPNGPYGLILSPTRELAIQIYDEAVKIAQFTRIRCLAMVGGHDIDMQAIELSRGVELLIGTPGRIKDCLERQYLVLNQCCYIVIDEADKIILLEQEPDLQAIMEKLPSETAKSTDFREVEAQEKCTKNGQGRFRITQLFSATMDPEIERIWRSYLRCPAYISIGEPGTGSSNISQKVLLVAENEKKWRLRKALKSTRPPALVFVNHKTAADSIVGYLEQFGFRAAALHGGKSQQAREQVMESFRAGSLDALVTTDLMSRGIDVEHIKHVINFDAPHTIVDYEHRIGRTGRAGASGLATTLLTVTDEELFADLKEFLLKNKQEVPPDLDAHPASRRKEEDHINI